jgi:hypothetical protein
MYANAGIQETHAVIQAGVGIFFQQEVGGFVAVKTIVKGGSAERDGTVQVGDRILSVDDRSVAGESLPVLRSLILGPQGSAVKMKFARQSVRGGAAEFSISLIRGTSEYFSEKDSASRAQLSRQRMPIAAPKQVPEDDGLVEQQFHDLLKYLMDWLYREKCDMLRSYHVWGHHEGAKYDPELMLINVEIYLSETLKLRSIALFESWLADWSSAKFEHSSAKFESVRNFSVEDKPARFICILKYLHSSRQLGSQLRLFRDHHTADSSSRPACSASSPIVFCDAADLLGEWYVVSPSISVFL